jgi:hypothetical protein
MMGLYVGAGEPAEAFSAFKRAQGLALCPAGPLLDLAGAAKASGRRAEALAALDAACGRKLDERRIRDAAVLYAGL